MASKDPGMAEDIKDTLKEAIIPSGRSKDKLKLNENLNFVIVIVALLSAVITSFMFYIQPKLNPGTNNETTALLRALAYNANPSAFVGAVTQVPQSTGVPKVLYASEYILYTALVITLGAGALALIIRLSSELSDKFLFRWLFKIFSSIIIWLTVLALLCIFGLLFLAVTLQLPIVVNSVSQ